MKLFTRSLIMIALALPGYAAGLPGKPVYEKVCSQCHGTQGSGNPAANSFFKMQIPRLDSEYVQKMSDAELKDVIMNGRRKMQPPIAGTPNMRHGVRAGQLNDVVAYIRSLKKGA